MNLRVTAFIVWLMLSSSASALQPLELGLAPLYERMNVINGEQQRINQQLQAVETGARDRAFAYRSYQALEKERYQLAQEIARYRALAQSPLVTFMAPMPEAR